MACPAAVLFILPFGSVQAEDAPVLSLPSGFCDAPITLTITAPAGLTVRYTTNGTLAAPASPDTALTFDSAVTLTAIFQ